MARTTTFSSGSKRPAPSRKRTNAPIVEGRQTMPAGKALVVMLVCLLLWAFLDAPRLKRAADASAPGTRRSVAVALLSPFAAISNVFQVTRLTNAVERALGRDPNEAPGGTIAIPPDPIPSPTASGGPAGPHAPGPKPSGPIRIPTATNKLRVVIVGDSLAAGLGTYMERVLKPSLVRVSRQGRISTGLARPDYFDWPTNLRTIVDNFDPDLVVIMLGENDNQPLQTPGGRIETPIGTFDWPKAYEQKVADFMHIATAKGARVVWVGLPNVADRRRWELIRRQNDLFQQAARQVRNVAFLDTWRMFAASSGGYTAYYNPGNNVQLVREPDGVHFNGAGYQLVAEAVAQLAERRFELTPRAVNP